MDFQNFFFKPDQLHVWFFQVKKLLNDMSEAFFLGVFVLVPLTSLYICHTHARICA